MVQASITSHVCAVSSCRYPVKCSRISGKNPQISFARHGINFSDITVEIKWTHCLLNSTVLAESLIRKNLPAVVSGMYSSSPTTFWHFKKDRSVVFSRVKDVEVELSSLVDEVDGETS